MDFGVDSTNSLSYLRTLTDGTQCLDWLLSKSEHLVDGALGRFNDYFDCNTALVERAKRIILPFNAEAFYDFYFFYSIQTAFCCTPKLVSTGATSG